MNKFISVSVFFLQDSTTVTSTLSLCENWIYENKLSIAKIVMLVILPDYEGWMCQPGTH